MNINRMVLILLVISMVPIISAQEDISDINKLIAEYDLNDDGVVILSISDNEDGAVLVKYDIYTGEYEHEPQQTPQTSSTQEPQVPGFTAIPVLLIIGSLYLIYRGTKE